MRLALEEEDWESELERAVVREVVSRLVLGGVLSKVGEGSFWWGVGLSLCGIRKEREGDGEALIEEKERRVSSVSSLGCSLGRRTEITSVVELNTKVERRVSFVD